MCEIYTDLSNFVVDQVWVKYRRLFLSSPGVHSGIDDLKGLEPLLQLHRIMLYSEFFDPIHHKSPTDERMHIKQRTLIKGEKMQISKTYEKMGLFYLGRELDLNGQPAGDAPFLYPSRNLTTHGVILGMTGSGKTGMGIGLIEEGVMDEIPSIIIDPKGDMGNLLLTFP